MKSDYFVELTGTVVFIGPAQLACLVELIGLVELVGLVKLMGIVKFIALVK